MTGVLTRSRVEVAESAQEAIARLAELGPDGAALAGGTWLMRDPTPPGTFIALHRISELHGVSVGSDGARWGALTTHTQLAAVELPAALRALGTAARISAFPQVRNVATIGGNICARGFAEADLVPALLALDASVDLATPTGRRTAAVADFLDEPARPALVTSISAPTAADRRSGYGRLIIRGGGEYPVACVAVSAVLDGDGVARDVRVAIGSVEARARRVPEAETVLTGTTFDATAAREAGLAAAAALTARDDLLAPGRYRLQVLPTVFERALRDLQAQES